mmetsp:Transcript_40444/g.71705  ORF Transcript_40444/g.71705 Transcript_40444/m.71705 type:complete len:81 (-) Transcript_40444:514-756(-)
MSCMAPPADYAHERSKSFWLCCPSNADLGPLHAVVEAGVQEEADGSSALGVCSVASCGLQTPGNLLAETFQTIPLEVTSI